ncbi:MAG: YggS family pyridoxal phosphate-dependent enzyme [Candidatus Omnitrophota bacterium]
MIRENIVEVKRRISAACLRAKRDPAAVKLIAVSKNRSAAEINEAVLAGITDLGENRVQEALGKYEVFKGNPAPIQWHMVGHLQTNKAQEAVRIFDLIQSVDSMRLANAIDKQAAKINKIQDILLEVKTSPEAAKFGVKPDAVAGVIKEISALKNINIKGLMTIAPAVSSPEQARPYFRELKDLRDKINLPSVLRSPLSILSMGMTDDFEVAIEEGSNMVRIGRAVFA